MLRQQFAPQMSNHVLVILAGDARISKSELEPKQIGDFDKKLAAVIDVASARPRDCSCGGIEHQMLQVAIVTNVDRGSGMQEVGDKKVAVKLLRSF